MTKVITIPWPSPKTPFPGANELEDAARAHWSVAHKLRKKWKDWFIIHMVPLPKRKLKRVWLKITYLEVNMEGQYARDPDNIAAIKKILLDSLKDAEVIPDDKHEQIAGWTESFKLDPNGGIRLRLVDMDKVVVEDAGLPEDFKDMIREVTKI